MTAPNRTRTVFRLAPTKLAAKPNPRHIQGISVPFGDGSEQS